MIDWLAFTPWTSLVGGVLIGLAVAVFILFNGRISGISGILGGLLRPVQADLGWRLAFLGGLIVSPLLYALVSDLPEVEIEAGFWQLILAGLLVGIGTRYGSGCTSGHGICGIARLSPRSIVATVAFMLAGMLVVFFMRHIFGD